jgi:hypothetical protein
MIIAIRNKVLNTTVKGVPDIERVTLVQKDDEWVIQTTGSNIAKLLEVKGIDKRNVRTNSVFEIAGTLGIEAARNLGCGKIRTVFSVIIPLAKIGLIIGAVFCFILSFGDFVSPYYLGGSKPPTLSILIIDTTKSGQQWPRAAVVALTMIVTLIVVAFAAVNAAYRRPK